MALRDDLISLVDDVRQDVLVDAIGTRLYTVQTRLRTWAGTQAGLGAYTDTVTTLEPRPRVRPAHDKPSTEAGKRETGELVADRISGTYTEADLFGPTLLPQQEWCWLVDGAEYVVIGKPEQRFLSWTVRLRRRGTRP
ncbi:MAG TPA: hypothetical protein VEB22_15490 [Phycisphaerales bacterium]|nr:hypothetical protein [Phycisphaerales bacterium]